MMSKVGLLSTYTVNGDMLDVGTLESYISAHIVKGEDNWISPNNVEISKSAIIKNSVILELKLTLVGFDSRALQNVNIAFKRP